ncbi:GntR family transcriptional regulator [Candidatus Bipolaricaulota bacterium]|nr:GntR family transcriptional regulator [Candidatus Bipolaricaulota bacterium]
MSYKKEIYAKIKDKIIFGDFHPGELLSEKSLADDFDCSRAPIREAFIKLESEGLVRIIPKKGTYVSQLSLDDLRENFAVRKHLNKLVGRLSAENATEEQLDELRGILDEINETNNYQDLLKLDYDFHRVVHKSTGNQILSDVMEILLTQAVRIWLFSIDKSSTNLMIPGNLQDIYQSIQEGDQRRTSELLAEHVQVTIDSIRESLLNL